MMNTLLAHEFRITRKRLAIAVGIATLVAAVSFLTALIDIPALRVLMVILGVIAVSVITPLVMAILVESYWRTMYGREGYFTMMLPVRGRTLFAAKVLYGCIAVFVSALITLLLWALGAASFAIASGFSVEEDFDALWEVLSAMDVSLLVFLVFCILAQLAYTVIAGATIMSVGAQARFNHLGFGAPVIGAIIHYVGLQIISLAAMLFVPIGMIITGTGEMKLVGEAMLSDFIRAMQEANFNGEPEVIGLGSVLVIVVLGVLFAWWGARSVERQTSLR
ncbi:MAG: hypothetical protein ACTIJ6_01960 [Leucobacter sp.]